MEGLSTWHGKTGFIRQIREVTAVKNLSRRKQILNGSPQTARCCVLLPATFIASTQCKMAIVTYRYVDDRSWEFYKRRSEMLRKGKLFGGEQEKPKVYPRKIKKKT